jgi:hypothetical protein
MKNPILGVLIGAIAGCIAGFVAGILCFSFLFPAHPASELVSVATDRAAIATGTFIHADPSDPMHYGSGTVTLSENLAHLEQDFEVGAGPKYHLYLVPDGEVTPDTRVEETMFVDLGRLKAFRGGQTYPIPHGTDLADYKSLVVWCEQFNLLISPAKLRFMQ